MRFNKTFGLIFLVIWSAAAIADEKSYVRVMMEKSGIVEQLSEIDENMHEGILSQSRQQRILPDDQIVELGKIVLEVMDSERLIADIEKSLVDTLSADDAQAMIDFYDTDLGQRVLSIEIAASTLEGQAEMFSRRDALLAELSKDAKRADLLSRADDSLHMTDISTAIVINFSYTMSAAILESQQRGGPEALGQLRAQIKQLEGQMSKKMQADIKLVFAYSYRNLSIDELGEYVDFLESDSSVEIYGLFAAAMYEILTDRGNEIGIKFGKFLEQEKS